MKIELKEQEQRRVEVKTVIGWLRAIAQSRTLWRIMTVFGVITVVGFTALFIVEAGDPDRPSYMQVVASDWAIYANCAKAVQNGQSAYQKGVWPDRQNCRYDLAVNTFFILLAQLEENAPRVIFLVSMSCIFAYALLTARLIKGDGFKLALWAIPLLLIAPSTTGTEGYANIDTLIVVAGLLLLGAQKRGRWLLGGILLALMLSTKPVWMVLLAYLVVKRDWRMLAKMLGVGVALYVATNAFAAAIVPNGVAGYFDWFRFMAEAGKNSRNVLVVVGSWANASLAQTGLNLFGEPGGDLFAGVASLAIVSLGLISAYKLLFRNRGTQTTNVATQTPVSDQAATIFALFCWTAAFLLQPQNEYGGLLTPILLYCWAATDSRIVKGVLLFGLPFALGLYPSLIALQLGVPILDIAESAWIIVAFTSCLVGPAMLLLKPEWQRQPQLPETATTSELQPAAQTA